MTTNPMCIRLTPEHLLEGLQSEALAAIQTTTEPELDLDVTEISRIDSGAALVLERIADVADQRTVLVRLRNVNVSVYKALTLLGLVRRFTFAN